jgi:hypothetical protein
MAKTLGLDRGHENWKAQGVKRKEKDLIVIIFELQGQRVDSPKRQELFSKTSEPNWYPLF